MTKPREEFTIFVGRYVNYGHRARFDDLNRAVRIMFTGAHHIRRWLPDQCFGNCRLITRAKQPSGRRVSRYVYPGLGTASAFGGSQYPNAGRRPRVRPPSRKPHRSAPVAQPRVRLGYRLLSPVLVAIAGPVRPVPLRPAQPWLEPARRHPESEHPDLC